MKFVFKFQYGATNIDFEPGAVVLFDDLNSNMELLI